ncbi:type II toxin-antitoxin system VapB family antitoxin [Streptomyces sp. NPDC046977]|uniref:type II toxin-antitoxin system VapB family antitoxin n=1 Tax=Streptomyces sp. NPDC046977 TaxID=3154703 RepID=UPI0033D48394
MVRPVVDVDVDDRMLAEAAEIFGTTTKAATGRAALEDAVKHHRRTSFLEWLAEGGLPDLTGADDARAASPGAP